MAHIVHCRICHRDIDTDKENDWTMPNKGWYYHKACYDDFAKKKGAIREGDLTIEADDDLWRGAVYDYLKKDLKMGVKYQKFLSQWNNFLKKGMTAKGIYFTLRYFYEIAKGDPKKSENGIGIVPYIYEDGTCYWGERNQKDKNIVYKIEEQIRSSMGQRVQVVLQKNTPIKNKEVDLASIAFMEDDE